MFSRLWWNATSVSRTASWIQRGVWREHSWQDTSIHFNTVHKWQRGNCCKRQSYQVSPKHQCTLIFCCRTAIDCAADMSRKHGSTQRILSRNYHLIPRNETQPTACFLGRAFCNVTEVQFHLTNDLQLNRTFENTSDNAESLVIDNIDDVDRLRKWANQTTPPDPFGTFTEVPEGCLGAWQLSRW